MYYIRAGQHGTKLHFNYTHTARGALGFSYKVFIIHMFYMQSKSVIEQTLMAFAVQLHSMHYDFLRFLLFFFCNNYSKNNSNKETETKHLTYVFSLITLYHYLFYSNTPNKI